VPLTAHGPQMAVTEPLPYAILPVIGVASGIPHEVVYLRQVKRGNIVFGGGGRGAGQRRYLARPCAAGKHALAVHADFPAGARA
jgi:sarcosine oxidase, subunit beta